LLGIGENGHIGFNDPHEANFRDPLAVRRVTLDRRCRYQQYAEGHFETPEMVPGAGLTLTCPTLMSAEGIVCSVPGARKAAAVRSALEEGVSEVCPGSVLREHANAHLFLDVKSASLLSRK
jgi:glucosamine-6-phosphate deaminase